ncbi:hypothetical protein DPMN_082565 [Dreissena polymorpha]|uniref:Uncharacterized protein n=1 Tax=Dreissena polymorpha TaxID=45954 RepID=A0A9D4BHK7_DREPO|nr:hypothetical protein DPMN_082565 [Dreissena polymorpha]
MLPCPLNFRKGPFTAGKILKAASLRFARQQKRLELCVLVQILAPEMRVECKVRTNCARPLEGAAAKQQSTFTKLLS